MHLLLATVVTEMEDIVAPIGDVKFDIERDLEEQVGALPLPFTGMDKSGSATCVFHLRGSCSRGSMCPYRHIKPDRTVVCKHWLRGLCKKGDSCEFLHEFDMSKMPECYFYSKFRACSNKECPFLHIDPESKVKDCPWYDRGFCRHGPMCRHRHTRRVACLNYLCGFCPDGVSCKFVHMRFDIPTANTTVMTGISISDGPNSMIYHHQQKKLSSVVCHYCNEVGHKIYTCLAIPAEEREELITKYYQDHHHHHNQHQQQNGELNKNHAIGGPTSSNQNSINMTNNNSNTNNNDHQIQSTSSNMPSHLKQQPQQYRPLDQVTCFKCGEKGHYANKCPKGYLAFLSPALKDLQQKRNSFNSENNNVASKS